MTFSDLFDFAYVPDWYDRLDELTALALPEPWKFKKPKSETKNTETPILERYINAVFKKQIIDYDSEPDPDISQDSFILKTSTLVFTQDFTPGDIS